MATDRAETDNVELKMIEPKESRPNACCQHIREFFSFTPKGSSPVNYIALFTVVTALFGSSYSITFLFPFLPEMVLYFGYSEEDKGYYAGFLASGMFAGRIFGSFFWGWMSDKYGRRPIMLICCLAVGLSNLMFGFSINLAMAVILRFLNGLFNGLVGASKTVLYEISDDTNQAAGMSGIALAWGSGVVLGPLISGFLAQPAKKYPSVFPKDTLFDNFPFLLPSLVSCFMCVFAFFIVLWKLPETLPKRSKLVKTKESDGDAVAEVLLEHPDESKKDGDTALNNLTTAHIVISKSKSTNNLEAHRGPVSRHINDDDNQPKRKLRKTAYSKSLGHLQYYTPYDDVCDIYGLGTPLNLSTQIRSHSQHSMTAPPIATSLPQISEQNVASNGHAQRGTLVVSSVAGIDTKVVHENGSESVIPVNDEKVPSGCCLSLKKMTLCRLLRKRDVLLSVLLYTGLSFAVIGWEELFIVWASTEARLGGLDLSTGKIGAAIGGASIGLLFVQVVLYPKLVSRFGALRVFQGTCVYLIIVSGLLPCLRYLIHQPIAMWVILLLMTGIQKLCVTSTFSSVSIFINNSVQPADAGSANGIGMTLSALGRTAAPVTAGSMFAWSITSGAKIGFPFDVNLAFVFMAFIFLVINIFSAFIPHSLEKQKKPTVDKENGENDS